MRVRLFTWAQRGTGYFLHALPVAEGATVERCWVGAGPRAFLISSSTAAITHRPLCPGGPATVYWEEVNNNMWITCLCVHTQTHKPHTTHRHKVIPQGIIKTSKIQSQKRPWTSYHSKFYHRAEESKHRDKKQKTKMNYQRLLTYPEKQIGLCSLFLRHCSF